MQTTDPTTSLTVSNDVTSVKAKIQDFITKFNDMYTTIKSQSASTSANRGLFIGDTNASSLLSILNSIPYSNVSGISTSQINSLSKLGITFDISTGMSLSNSTQLDDAISNNNDQVTALFNSTNGIASTLYNRVNPYLGSTGYIANSRTNFTDSINYINDSITARQSRIVKSAAVLRNNYLKLQSQLADLLTTQSMFSSNLFSASS
jgi:flagellar hook-associated protein 2